MSLGLKNRFKNKYQNFEKNTKARQKDSDGKRTLIRIE